MSRTLKIYQGEDLTPVIDVTEPSSNVHVIWEEVEAGGRAFRGESNIGTFPMRDEQGETGSELNLPSNLTHTSVSAGSRIEWLVNGVRLFWGRIGPKDYSRGRQKADRAREVVVSANDQNYDLRNIIVDGWDRPEETDVARVNALITDYLTGNPRATTNISSTYVSSSNTVTLGPKVYDATDPATVLSEVATIADKLHFVTIDDELFYDGYDSAAYVSGIRISDRYGDVDTSASCTPGLGGATAISTPNGDFETGLGTNWSGAQVAANIPTPTNGTDWCSSDTGAGAGGWTYDGWTALTFLAGVTYTVRFLAIGTGDQRATFGVFTDDDNITDGAQIRSNLGTLNITGGEWTVNCIEWTPSANRTGVRFSHSRGGSSALGTDELTLWLGALVDCGIPTGGTDLATFPPIWDVGPSSTEDGMELLSGLRLYYGQGSNTYVYVNDPTTANSYWHSEQSLYTNDTLIDTPAKATTLAESILQHRKFEQRTYNVSIGPMSEDQVGCLKPGQLIEIKARAIPDADDAFVTRRIAQLRWTTPVPGTYFAHMMLDRPMKTQPSGIGPKQATDSINRHVEQGSNSHPEYVLRGTLTTQGDLPYRGASDWTRLGIGASNTQLVSTGQVPIWAPKDAAGGGMTNPMTTQGDIITGGASGAAGRLAIGTAAQVLTVNAGATAPEWAAAPGGGGDFTFIGETVLGSSATTIEVSSIPATYRDLVVVATVKTDRATYDTDFVFWRVGNAGISSTNYQGITDWNGGSDSGQTTLIHGGVCATSSGGQPADVFSSHRMEIFNYASTTQRKQFWGEGVYMGVNKYWSRISGQWASTSAVTNVRIEPDAGTNFVAGSALTVYGRG